MQVRGFFQQHEQSFYATEGGFLLDDETAATVAATAEEASERRRSPNKATLDRQGTLVQARGVVRKYNEKVDAEQRVSRAAHTHAIIH